MFKLGQKVEYMGNRGYIDRYANYLIGNSPIWIVDIDGEEWICKEENIRRID